MNGLSDIVEGWAHQNVTVEPPIGWDRFANPIVNAGTTYAGIVIQTNKMVLDRQGKQVVSSCQILFPAAMSVPIESRITLPDGTQPTIINVGKIPYFDGGNCVTVVYT